MSDKSGKKLLWIYASILFACIFLILIISAYSQIKFENNIENYRLKLSEQENLKLESEINLKTAMEEIKKLKEGASISKSQSESVKQALEEEKKKREDLEKQLQDKADAYEKLIRAEEQIETNQIAEGVMLLLKIKVSLLSNEGQKLYNHLLSDYRKKAAEELYIRGYDYFENRKYGQAVELFKNSMDLDVKDYYTDDCIFLAGLSYYNLKDKTNSALYFKRLQKEYPQSGYITETNRLLKTLE